MQDRVKKILEQMTLSEKCSLLSGMDFWHTQAVERVGLPAIMVSDGPHGLRRQASEGDPLGLNESVPATCFPTGVGLGSSWDRDLIFQVGALIGEEAQAQGVSVVLGPACNIKRSPLCGRNFEYLSEDPFLSSQMAKHHILGVQSQGVGTSIKHFCANNQEHNRMTTDTIIDERTLHEIYLASFETAVREAEPWTVMCSYNSLNGTYVSENSKILTDVLRQEWGYQGLVMSDWGAVNQRVPGVAAGMDLEMPSSDGAGDRKVEAAVKSGRLEEFVVDLAAVRLIELVFKAVDMKKSQASFDASAHHAKARQLAAQCMVLLKNDQGLLPLADQIPLAVIGTLAGKPRYQGGGSSHINPTSIDAALAEIRKFNAQAAFADGYNLKWDTVNLSLQNEAVALAQAAGTAIIFAGLPDRYESEGYDRAHMALPPNQNALISAVAAVCPRVVVVLANGSPVEMPWLASVPAVLEGYLPGQAGGGAIADLLFGRANPCGKLAESFPLKLSDNPSFLDFPGYANRVVYGEGLYVGYRYYDKKQLQVLFPFGHGLSYTAFTYSDLKADRAEFTEEQTITVTARIRNTGTYAGKEVVQLYLSYPQGQVPRVPQELKGFAKIALEPGEEKEVEFCLDHRSLAYYDTRMNDWLTESGPVEIRLGSSSRDIRLTTQVMLTALHHVKPVFTLNSTLSDLQQHPASAEIAKLALQNLQTIFGTPETAAPSAHPADQTAEPEEDEEEEDPFAGIMAAMTVQLPLRSILGFSNGAMSEEDMLRLIAACNQAVAAS